MMTKILRLAGARLLIISTLFYGTSLRLSAQCNVNERYDKIVSGYHQSIAVKSDGSFAVWGQDIANGGSSDLLSPTSVNATNFPALTGTPLKGTIGGSGSSSGEQFILLTGTGLFAWGNTGKVLASSLTTSSTFQKIATPTGGDASTKLPTGVAPSDVSALVASYQTLAILTSGGNVWVMTQASANLQGDGTALSNTTWHQVKTDASTVLGNVTAIRLQVSNGTQNAMVALTSSGSLYTWGSSVYLGNGTTSTSKNYATQMTLPAEFTSSNKPKMIGVTGGINGTSSVKNTFYVLSNLGSLYALGDNVNKQCGDFTTTERTSWVNCKKDATHNFSDIKFISVQEHDASFPAVAGITTGGDIYTWGENPKNMIGRAVDGNTYDPGLPGGFTSGTDKALSAEMGGHTLVYLKEGSSQFCYVGHKVSGSMGDNDATDASVSTFNCSGTPSLSICGSVPVAASTINSTISANPTSIVANGTSTSTVTVQLKDASNVNLTSSGGTVTISNTAGSLSDVTDNNNGTYTATLTSGNAAASAVMGFTVNGTAASGTATVTFTSGATPSITVSGTLSAFSSCSGAVSASQSFTVSGSNLTNDMVVTAPTGYEIALTGTVYSGSLTLTQSGGTVASTSVYARLQTSATNGASGNFTITSSGATSQIISVTAATVSAATVGGSLTAVSSTLCSGGTGTLTVTGQTGDVSKWQSSADGNTWSDIVNTNLYYVTGKLTQTTLFRAVLKSGSCSVVNSSVLTETVSAITVSLTPASVSLTSGSSAVLTATGAVTYSWSPTAGLSAANIASVTAKPSVSTTYTVTGTNSDGCSASAGVLVTVLSKQDSIYGNGPILASQTPKLTFKITTGTSPYTVVYRSAKNNKNDTLTNVLSNTAVTVASISSTTLYTLISVKDANGTVWNSNFLRDTATITVLQPKIVVTLKADPPVLQKDSSWSTRLVVKTKNIGDLDLSNTQTKLGLSDVFPKPVTYVLDSVTMAGSTVVPNKKYDGVGTTELFARLTEQHKPKNICSDIQYLNEESNWTDIVSPDKSAGKKTVEIWESENPEAANSGLEVYDDGHSVYLFGVQSALPVGVEANTILYLHIRPNGYNQPFILQANASGDGTTALGTTTTTSLSNDNPDVSVHPEVNNQGNPVPTVINLFPDAKIGVALSAGTPVAQLNGSYNVPLTYTLTNYGNLNLQSVKVFQNLLQMIGAPATFSVVGQVSTTNTLLPNALFDGKTDSNLLAASSIIGYGQTATITVTINIQPNQLSAVYMLQATASGYSGDFNIVVTDLSTDGVSPDPNGDKSPAENTVTLIALNQTIPALVSGNIGMQNASGTWVNPQIFCSSANLIKISPRTVTTGGYPAAYQYQWQSSADSLVFVNISGATDSVYTTGKLVNTVYLRRMIVSGNQTAYSNVVSIKVSVPDKPVITASGPLTLTANGVVILSSSAASSYLWSNNSTSKSVLIMAGGKYSVTTTDANGCNATSDSVTVIPAPPVVTNGTYLLGAAANPVDVSAQVTASLYATLNYYKWATGGMPTTASLLPTAAGVTTYYVSQTQNRIESAIVSYTVTMLDPLKMLDIQKSLTKAPALQSDGSYVTGFTLTASNLRTELLDSIKLKDDLSKVFPSSTQFQVLDVSATGKLVANKFYDGVSQTDLLSAGSQLPGAATDSVKLLIKLSPNGFSGPLTNMAEMTAKSPYGIIKMNSNDPLTGNGLLVRSSTKFQIPLVDFFIPSGFSPNKDGVNDVFVITHPFNTQIRLEVYNRWGNLVYRAADYKNDWDGRGNQPNQMLGNELPDGTYYYLISAQDMVTGSLKKFTGYVILKRN